MCSEVGKEMQEGTTDNRKRARGESAGTPYMYQDHVLCSVMDCRGQKLGQGAGEFYIYI